MIVRCSLTAAVATFSLAGVALAASPPDRLALTGARIIPVVGPEIDNGTILIEHGIITAIGANVDLPYDAMEVDVTGKVLFPGMIDPHSWRGLDVPNENVPVAPFLDVYDAIDPSRLFFEDSLRDGITTVHIMQGNNCVISGLSRLVRPIGLSVDELTVMPDVALKLVTTPRRGSDRMEQLALLREAFRKLDDTIGDLAEKKYEDHLKDREEQLTVGPDEARRRGMELLRDSDYGDDTLNLIRLRRGDLAAWFYVGRATDVRPALEIADEQGLIDRTVFVLGNESHRAAAELKDAERPVVLSPSLYHRQRDPITGRLQETFIPKVIHDAGLTFALQPNPSASLAERYLNYQAAVCVRNGVPRDVALKAITLYPAQIIGMGDQLGSLEVGKVANIVVFSGDPLDFSSWVEQVYIDGILAYDRERDHRLQELLKLREEDADATGDEAPAAADDGAEGSNG
jgi:imidazolonepropionase-like amidohydrolase